ncbi:MAG: AAA family ATPase [Flavobacteriales bacterium]|nr:AAA family ATPase [Flavobacteriales bacterium]
MKPNLYIIAGCNGAGKTTASMTLLPEILDCDEFVNADSIAAGLSPFRPEKVAFEAGRIMLHRIDELLETKVDFAFETTLSTKSYRHRVERAQKLGYMVTLVFLWLPSKELAVQRVAERVLEGGHDIPEDVIRRRYTRGIKNLLTIYLDICDQLVVVDNAVPNMEVIAEKVSGRPLAIVNPDKWSQLKTTADEK